jgi:hypothetical protein
LFEEWQALDLRAVAKVKLYHARHRVTEQDRALLEGGSRSYRLIKSLRRTSDKMRGKKSSGRLERAIKKVKGAKRGAAAAAQEHRRPFRRNKPVLRTKGDK